MLILKYDNRGCVSRGCRGVAHPRNLRRVHFTPPKFDRQLDKRVVKFKVCSKNYLFLDDESSSLVPVFVVLYCIVVVLLLSEFQLFCSMVAA